MTPTSVEGGVRTMSMGGMTFRYIGNETYRQLEFPKPWGVHVIRIENPAWVYVSASGGHRYIDRQGIGHYIYSDGRRLFWDKAEGADTFEW